MRELADELFVYDLDRHSAVCLNRTAAVVWRSCDGAADVAAIARSASAELSQPFNVDAVWCALDGLEKQGLLEPLGAVAERPRRTRREWLRELGRSGFAAALIPSVLAVVAPSAAQALSYITKADCEMRKPPNCGGNPCGDMGRNCVTFSATKCWCM